MTSGGYKRGPGRGSASGVGARSLPRLSGGRRARCARASTGERGHADDRQMPPSAATNQQPVLAGAVGAWSSSTMVPVPRAASRSVRQVPGPRRRRWAESGHTSRRQPPSRGGREHTPWTTPTRWMNKEPAGQQHKTPAVAGVRVTQPQRDSNPCRHLESVVTVRDCQASFRLPNVNFSISPALLPRSTVSRSCHFLPARAVF